MFKNYNNYGNSSFWLDNNSDIDVLTGEKLSSGKDLVQLSSYKRAIANFVQIVTGQLNFKVAIVTLMANRLLLVLT